MKCNLVLSGGGTRGYAHLGVIQALLEKGIIVEAVSGASCGAIIGAFICDGFHPAEIEELLVKHEPEVGINLLRFWENLLSFDAYAKLIKNNLRSSRIENLKKPLYVSVTNLKNGKQELITEGNLLDALVASAAIPVLFPAKHINQVPYADGGLSNNLPVEPFIPKKLPIIGVHANPLSDFNPGAGMIHQLDRSLHLLMRNSVENNIQHCDLFIEPSELQHHHLFETKHTRELINIGYRHVIEKTDLTSLRKTL